MSPAARRPRTARGRRRGLHPLLVAGITIALAAFITFYAFNGGLPFVHRFTLYAVINNSVNVRPNDPVRVAGVDVGAVSGTTPDGNRTKIAFTVNSNARPVHTDATITIRDRLFLEGSYYIDLNPGSPSAPAVGDGSTLQPAQTRYPVQFFQVLSTFDLATRQNLANLIETLNQGFSQQPGQPLSASGAAGLKAAIPQFTPTLKDVAWVSQGLRGTRPGDLERLLSSASQVTSTLQNSAPELGDLVTGLDRTSTALAAADGSLAQSIAGLDQLLQTAPPALTAVDNSLPPLTRLAVALDPSLKIAPPILTDVTSAVDELARIVAPAERRHLLTSLRATFEQFPVLLHELGQAFPVTKQVTDCLRTHVLPIFNAKVPDGSLSTNRPVWQDFIHFLPNVGGASANFDANGPYTRTLLGAGTNSLEGLGVIPGLGQLVGTAPPGGGSVQGARPAWIGDLTPQDFRPDVPCATQAVPSLGATTAASDLRTVASAKPNSLLTLSGLRNLLTRRAGGR